MPDQKLSSKHLIGIRDLSLSDINLILETSKQFKEVLQRPIKKVPSLRDITIANLFFENSTRTRMSFELAEKRLTADVINFSSGGSSVSKGETLLDTVQNILAMKVDMIEPQNFYLSGFRPILLMQVMAPMNILHKLYWIHSQFLKHSELLKM
jgi:aspartate carbamoyltransferase catalytic subunit